MKQFRNIFVTVGTTEFQNLTKTIITERIFGTMKKFGCEVLTMQIGSDKNFDISNAKTLAEKYGIEIKVYRLKSSIFDDILEADLIISHAGAGSCIEALKARKTLVVVVNDKLMHNHQDELAEQMHKEGYVLMCVPKTLPQTLSDLPKRIGSLKPYKNGTVLALVQHLDTMMGF